MFTISNISGIKLPLPITALRPHTDRFLRSLVDFNGDANSRNYFLRSIRESQPQCRVELSTSRPTLPATRQLHQWPQPQSQPELELLREKHRLRASELVLNRTMEARFNKPNYGNPTNHDNKMPPHSFFRPSRPTHFICFPLVTPTSIPQLAASLERFREVTTETPEIRMRRRWAQKQQQRMKERQREGGKKETTENDRGSESDDALTTTTTEENVEDALKILPHVVHRPPGTFHLTIGVMDLSEEGKLERAVRVLRNLDVGELLGEVEQEIGYECPSVSTVTAGQEQCRNDNVNDGRDLRGKLPNEQQHQQRLEATTSATTPAPPALKSDNIKEALMATGQDPHNNVILSLTKPVSPPPLPPKPSPIATSSPIIITLSSLRVFSTPRKARVFYAPPSDPSSRLLPIAKKILSIFKDEGLVADDEHDGNGGGVKKRELTLHATVANMRYAKNTKQQGGGGSRAKGKKDGGMLGVDARGVLDFFNVGNNLKGRAGEAGGEEGARKTGAGAQQEHGGFVWAKDILIDKVWICKMGAEASDDPVLGMVYPPVKTKGGVLAEVRFGERNHVG